LVFLGAIGIVLRLEVESPLPRRFDEVPAAADEDLVSLGQQRELAQRPVDRGQKALEGGQRTLEGSRGDARLDQFGDSLGAGSLLKIEIGQPVDVTNRTDEPAPDPSPDRRGRNPENTGEQGWRIMPMHLAVAFHGADSGQPLRLAQDLDRFALLLQVERRLQVLGHLAPFNQRPTLFADY